VVDAVETIRALLAAGQPEEAGRLADALPATDRSTRLRVARLANDHGHYLIAERLARALIATDGQDAQAWSALGFAAFSLGHQREARAALERALSLDPHYDAARRNLAAVLCDQEWSEETLAQVARLESLGRVTPAIERIRSRALMQLSRYEEAEAVLRRLLTQQPVDGASHELLLRVRQLRGDADPASDLRIAAAADTADPRLRLTLADALRRMGDIDGAERELHSLLAKFGALPALVGSLANLYQDRGAMTEAHALAARALVTAPGDVNLAEVFVATGIASGSARATLPVIERMRASRPLDQRWITHRLDAARMLGEAQFEEWFDPARVTRAMDLPTPVGFHSLDGFLAAVHEEIAALHPVGNHPLDQSLRLGTQTSRNLLVHPSAVLGTLLESFATAAEQFRAEVIGTLPPAGPAGPHPLVARNVARPALVGCWSVKLRRGGFHVNHIHPEGWLSSAFYLSVPAEVSDTTRRAGWLKFGEPRYRVEGLEPTGYVQPAPGRLVLFPSYLWHGTNPIATAEPRVSVAFDAVPATELR
jgi:tetratricopeptide (TPR) repeat protein